MTKVIITGMLAEKPKKSKLSKGREKVSVIIIEQTMTYGKKLRENKFQVVFTGKRIKQTNCLELDKGDIVVAVGQLNGIERDGRFLHYIYGQQLVLIKKLKKEVKQWQY